MSDKAAFIPVNIPHLSTEERDAVLACLDSGWVSSEGPFVARFEEEYARLCNRKFGVAVTNGTTALEIAVESLGLSPGDKVILPAFTIISCIQAVIKAGLEPVLVDCCPQTWTMDVDQVAAKAKDPAVRAIMPVHIYGLPCAMDAILEIAERHNLYVIEDAAEAHGLTTHGRVCGSFGDVSTFSFYPNKLVTTGEGGMILTDRQDIAEKLRSKRNLCFSAERRFVHHDLGHNARMTSLQAALGTAQLPKMQNFLAYKRRMGAFYSSALADVEGIQLPLASAHGAENMYWVYGIVLRAELGVNAQTVMQKLAELGVGSRPFFWPMHKQPVLQNMGLFIGEHYPVSEYIAEHGFYLPSGLGNTFAQYEKSANALKQVLEAIHGG